MNRALAAAACVIVAAAPAAPHAPPARFRFLYPAHRSIQTGPFDVIVVGRKGGPAPRLTMGNHAVKLTRIRFSDTWIMPGLLTATALRVGDRADAELWIGAAKPKQGPSALRVGSTSLAVHVGRGAPKGWPQAAAHGTVPSQPGKTRCSGCHEMEDGMLGRAPADRACGTCHSDLSVQTTHKHVTPPLARCAMCHDPHGSTRAKLLTDAKEKLCTRCHAGGHSKG